MTSASIGIRAALQWRLRKRNSRRGFTLLEALVALALLLTFAATLTPLLYQARRIMDNADRRVAADMVLRSVLAAPVDRANLANLSREGETGGLQWQISAQPMAAPALPVTPSKTKPQSNKENADKKAAQEDADWATYLVSATVTYAPGRTLSAETVRLGKAE
ncbi:MAG TPA: prepilin-type N-terminal cleavage/methylation domain-containing protein [Pseudolabrys sp.]|jgi:prepilin-type N-terminal cleavage/methylation domain-containing protein|nr:prepilin-type N-terminal cleavage/methylation domain-containing protein [Pseudolabrys sp.]